MRDIYLVRQYNVIDGRVSIPENQFDHMPATYGTILRNVPGTHLRQLTTRSGQLMVATDPGFTACCKNDPADSIAETIKTYNVPVNT